jgi:predicted Zn-dependent protease
MIALVVILALGVVPAHAQNDWQRFTHPTMGFSMSYPPGWVAETANNPNLPLIIVGPRAASMSSMRMGAVVISLPIAPKTTVEDMLGNADKPLREQVGDVRILRVDRTKLNGIPAAMAYATSYTPQGRAIYVMVLLMAAGSRGYAVTGFTALDSTELPAETRQLQAILASFRLGKGSLDQNAVAPSGPGELGDRVYN